MTPRREPFETLDRRTGTLWRDIDDTMSAIVTAYSSMVGNDEKSVAGCSGGIQTQNGIWFRHCCRPPIDDATLMARQKHTDRFIDALQAESKRFGLTGLADSEYPAIAQHYGLYTPDLI